MGRFNASIFSIEYHLLEFVFFEFGNVNWTSGMAIKFRTHSVTLKKRTQLKMANHNGAWGL